LSPVETELVLAMVDAAARSVAPEEYRDAFEDYAAQARVTGVLPGTGGGAGSDRSAAGIADGAIYLGMGLSLLGHLGLRVLMVATDMAIKKGLADAGSLVRRLLKRKDAVEALAEQVVDSADPPAGADRATLVQVVVIQIQVLGTAEE
jgi:hypothetical protein